MLTFCDNLNKIDNCMIYFNFSQKIDYFISAIYKTLNLKINIILKLTFYLHVTCIPFNFKQPSFPCIKIFVIKLIKSESLFYLLNVNKYDDHCRRPLIMKNLIKKLLIEKL